MCDVESISKIAKYLKVNAGRLSYSNEKGLVATTKNGTLCGYATILQSISAESKDACVQSVASDWETQCLIRQWLEYAVIFVDPARKDRNVANTMLKELNSHLSTRSYLVEQSFSLADLVVFYAINAVMASLSSHEKENYVNVSRWYDHLQRQPLLRQGQLVNFSTIHLC